MVGPSMMRLWRSLTFKWLFTLLFTGLFGVGLVWFLANRATNTGFDQLKLDQAEADYAAMAQTYYEQHGSWAGFSESLPPPQQQYIDQQLKDGRRGRPP